MCSYVLLHYNMKDFSRVLFLSAVYFASVEGGILQNATYRLDIVHYNDFHARFEETSLMDPICTTNDTRCLGGFARLFYEIKHILKQKHDALLLNAGDDFQGTYWYTLMKSNVSTFINLLPHDAHTLGNHEFDDGVAGLVSYLKALEEPIVVANLDVSLEPSLQGLFQSHVVLERNGRKIGIIGVTTNDTKTLSNTQGVRFLDPLPIVQKEAKLLTEQGVDIIIVLSHCGLNVDKEMAKKVGENVDIIVGGHSHSLLWNGTAPSHEVVAGRYPLYGEAENKPGHKVLIVTASAYSKYLGNIRLDFNSNGEVVSFEAAPVFLDRNIPEDPEVKALLKPYIDNIHKTFGVVIATPRPIPKPQSSCVLAYDGHYMVGDPYEGYRFGTNEESRIEYAKLPGPQSSKLELTVTLRTVDTHGGLIFYATAETAPTQFLAIYMKHGKIHFLVNCGNITTTIVTPSSYNGTDWHTLTISRSSGQGKITVDSETIVESSVSCTDPATLTAPYYYGGLKSADSAKAHLGDFYQPFNGCLSLLMMNGQYVTEILQRENALRCTDNIEDGVYFGPSTNTTSNYLKLQEHTFRVDLEISISMEIKPRNATGLLFAAHGKKDYLVLELLENEVVINVENGKGEFSASHKLAEPNSLCDGNWHTITVVKSRHVVSVGIDRRFSDAGLGSGPSTDTRSALYIGGHVTAVARVRGARSKRGFTGCIRNILVRERPVPIPLSAAYGNTHVGVCPID